MLVGLDISHHQGAIDWDKLAPQLSFVFIKATQGPGPLGNGPGSQVSENCFADSKFGTYRQHAAAKKLIRSYYHFAIPSYVPFHNAVSAANGGAVHPGDYESDAVLQARYFCDTIGTLEPGELDLVLDLEATKYGHGDHPLSDVEIEELQTWTVTFVDTVRARFPGRSVILYSYGHFFRSCLDCAAFPFPESLKSCPLWIAELPHGGSERPPEVTADWEQWATSVNGQSYAPSRLFWTRWTFWQFSWAARIDGFPTNTDVDADLFYGTMAELRRLAGLDQVIPPVIEATFDALCVANEQGNGGYYPIGANNFWHGGSHLGAERALCAVADGSIVAYRVSHKPMDLAVNGTPCTLSNSFVLTHHKRYTPKGVEIDFFVLYMHLLPLDCYTENQRANPPPLFARPKFTVCTHEDGGGLNIRSGTNADTILGVIPKDAQFSADPTKVASWNAAYKQIEYAGTQGYAAIANRSKLISGTTYQCTTAEDYPPLEQRGLNVRAQGAGTRVLRVVPHGTEIAFEDPSTILKGNALIAGWYDVKGGGMAYVRTGEAPTVLVEFILDRAEFDKVVKVERAISPGTIIGYPGPYLNESQTVHFEVFMAGVDFMKNPKKEKGGPTTLEIPAGTIFKLRTPATDELVRIDAPVGARLALLKQGGQYRQVKLQELVGWAKRTALGDWKNDHYQLTQALEAIAIELPAEGATPVVIAIHAPAGSRLRFLEQNGGYRKVRYVLPSAKQKTGWALRSDLGTWNADANQYFLSNPLASLHKNDPRVAYQFTEDAGTNDATLFVDLRDATEPEVIEDAQGALWQEEEFADGMMGWISHTQNGTTPWTSYDWPGWQRIEEKDKYSDDGLCDAADIISIIDADADGNLTSREIVRALGVRRLAARLRRLACLHPTEWSGEIKGIQRLAESPWNLSTETLDVTKNYIKSLGFWNDLATLGLPPAAKVWHVHPIGFLLHLRKIPTSGTKPATSTNSTSPKTQPTESIIVVGSEMHYNSFWFKMMFVASGVLAARRSKSTRTTVAFVDVGYTRFERLALESLRKEINANIIKLESSDDLVKYVNERQFKYLGGVAVHPIRAMYFFTHGYPRFLTNHGIIDLNYEASPSILVDEECFTRMRTTAFAKDATIYSYACRTGNGQHDDGPFEKDADCKPQESLAQRIANHLGVKVYAFLTRSDYGTVLREPSDSTRIRTMLKKARETQNGKLIQIPPDHEAMPHPGLAENLLDEFLNDTVGRPSGPHGEGTDEYALWRKQGARCFPTSHETPKGLTPGMWLFQASKPPKAP